MSETDATSRIPFYPRESYGVIHESPEVTLHEVGEFDPEVEGAGTPVFAVVSENDSFLTFACLPAELDDGDLRVFHAKSYVSGEFSTLLNAVVRRFCGDEDPTVVFTNVVSEFLSGANLREKLDGFSEREVRIPEDEPHAGQVVVELVGTWESGRRLTK